MDKATDEEEDQRVVVDVDRAGWVVLKLLDQVGCVSALSAGTSRLTQWGSHATR